MRIKDMERAMGEVTKDSDLSRSCLRLADVLCVAETCHLLRNAKLESLDLRCIYKLYNNCINRLETEFSSYKEAEKEVLSVSAERDKALQDLKDSLAYHERELSER
nr:protein GRIP [Ipomoea batatas]